VWLLRLFHFRPAKRDGIGSALTKWPFRLHWLCNPSFEDCVAEKSVF
jgi:hypothetical protein